MSGMANSHRFVNVWIGRNTGGWRLAAHLAPGRISRTLLRRPPFESTHADPRPRDFFASRFGRGAGGRTLQDRPRLIPSNGRPSRLRRRSRGNWPPVGGRRTFSCCRHRRARLFTGLRIGVTAAKTLAYAVGAEVIGLNTLQVIAAQSPPSPQLCAVLNAQREQLFAAASIARPGWDAVGAQIVDQARWLGCLPPGMAVTGPVWPAAGTVPGGIPCWIRRCGAAGGDGRPVGIPGVPGGTTRRSVDAQPAVLPQERGGRSCRQSERAAP